MPETGLKKIAARFHLNAEQAAEILQLLDDGYSIPYVMRYHKELAAALQPQDFYELIEERARLERLESRRRKILKKLEERDILTEDLAQKINQATDLRELIDYYVPYRPRKRSRSRQALAQGLESLATQVLAQQDFVADMTADAEPFIDPEKGLPNVEAVLEGVFYIVCDWLAEEKSHRDRQRQTFREGAAIIAQRASRSLPGRLVREFKPYFDYRKPVSQLHPYHMLTILRGKRLKALRYSLETPLQAMERTGADLYLPGGASHYEQVRAELGDLGLVAADPERLKTLNGTEFLAACIHHSLQNILAPIAARELDKELCKKAEGLALEIIRRNVRSVLMVKPVAVPALGIHPGYRTGCQLAALDAEGNVLEAATVYPHPPVNEAKEARETVLRMINEHGLQTVAIGEGTGAQETETLVSALIAEQMPDLRYAVISEVGLESYANSRAARTELPDVKSDERWAVAVGRRLQDPLAELVKINPRELCPASVADDVNPGALKKLLDRLLEQCVCQVGADVNKADYSLLRHISGLGPEKALELADYREKKGALRNRQELIEVPKIDRESFDRAVGFLRVGESNNPLDRTRIHPRFYAVAEAICEQLGIPLADLTTEQGRGSLKEHRSELQLADLEKQFDVHYLLLKDMLDEMAEPWPDPRRDEPAPVLRKGRMTIADLEPDQWHIGTVRNIVDFGVFVDIGVGEDGLVHISELSDKYVESPYDVVCVDDRVRVRIVRVDEEKGRIALSMTEKSARRPAPAPRPRERRPADRPRPREQVPAAEVPSASGGAAFRTPRSTVGSKSRRVEKAAAKEAADAGQPTQEKQAPKEAAPREAEKAEKAKEEEAVGLEGLLEKLDFASIERRGEPAD